MGGYEVISFRAPLQAKSAVVLGLTTVVGLVIAVSQHLTDGGLMTNLINTSSHRSVAKSAADPSSTAASAVANPLWGYSVAPPNRPQGRAIFSSLGAPPACSGATADPVKFVTLLKSATPHL